MSDLWEKKALEEAMSQELRAKISLHVRGELRRRRNAREGISRARLRSPATYVSVSGIGLAAIAAILFLREPSPPALIGPEPQMIRHAEMLLDLPVLEKWKELKARMEKKKWNRKQTMRSNG